MADIASIVDDVVAAGLDPRRLAFVSVHMRFAGREAWEGAVADAASGWEVAAYSTAQGHMLRLSRRAHPSARDLAKLRADALLFADCNSADWQSMSIEDLQQAPTAWQALTVSSEVTVPEQRTSPAVENDHQVRRLQRGGTA